MVIYMLFLENVTALAKLYGVEVKKEGVAFMKTDRLGVGFKLENSDFKIKDYINRQNVIGSYKKKKKITLTTIL